MSLHLPLAHTDVAYGDPVTGSITGLLPLGEIGYRGHDDIKLRGALFEVWNGICHRCERPQLFVDTQIDHIIPRTIDPTHLSALIAHHGLAAGFHVDRPRNLALICPGCNRTKSNRVPRARSYTDLLETAWKHEFEVIRQVRQQATANAVARHLTRAATANLHDPAVVKSFLRHGPAITRTLALLDESKADFDARRDFDFHIGNGFFMPVSLSLDACGRGAQSTIETVGGCTVAEALDYGLGQLINQVHDEVESHIERYRGETGDIGPVGIDHVAATVRFRDLRRRDARLTVRFTGVLRGSYTASVVDTDQWGDGLTDTSVTAWVDLDFTIAASWKLTGAPGRPHRIRTKITADEIETTQS